MAEIKIEKKKVMWPWVLLILGVTAMIIYYLTLEDTPTRNIEKPDTDELVGTIEKDLLSVKENNIDVLAFIDFVGNEKNKMSLSHAYTSEALLKLVTAIEAISKEVDYEILADLGRVRDNAKVITQKPLVNTHADTIRNATDILTGVLQNLQQSKYPGLNNEVSELKAASESIKPEILTLNQKNEVKNYFHKAADLLQKMN